MADLESLTKEEAFNPFLKEGDKLSKYAGFKGKMKNFIQKPSQYLNEKIGYALKKIFLPYL